MRGCPDEGRIQTIRGPTHNIWKKEGHSPDLIYESLRRKPGGRLVDQNKKKRKKRILDFLNVPHSRGEGSTRSYQKRKSHEQALLVPLGPGHLQQATP